MTKREPARSSKPASHAANTQQPNAAVEVLPSMFTEVKPEQQGGWRRERDSNFTAPLTPRKLLISGYAKRGKTGKSAYRGHNLGTAFIRLLHPTTLTNQTNETCPHLTFAKKAFQRWCPTLQVTT